VAQIEEKGPPHEKRHPPHLTEHEFIRFIQSYYQIWGLLMLPATQLQDRIKCIPLKQLYYLTEMADFRYQQAPFYIEQPPWLRYPWFPGSEHGDGSVLASYVWAADGNWKGYQLKLAIEKEIERKYQERHGIKAPNIQSYTLYEGNGTFCALWDHGSEEVEYAIANPRR
jgi:hypothetical protein